MEKCEEMKKKIYAISVIVIVLTIISFAFYIWRFFMNPLSTNPSDWSSFGSYVGGIIGPLLMIGNIIFLYYLNYQQTRDLQKPFGVIDIGDYEDKIYVRLKNIGAGPLIIENVRVVYKGEEKDNLIDFMPDLPKGVYWNDFVRETKGKGVGRDSYMNLILIESENEDIKSKLKKEIREILKDVTVEIFYNNIFKEYEGSVSRSLKVFEQK